MENHKPRLRVSWVGLALALFFLIYGIAGITKFASPNLVGVEAVIEEIETSGTGRRKSHTVYATYTYEDKTYTGVKLDHYVTGMNVGDTMEIKIDPDKPGKVVTQSGFLSVALGVFLGAKAIRKAKPDEESDTY